VTEKKVEVYNTTRNLRRGSKKKGRCGPFFFYRRVKDSLRSLLRRKDAEERVPTREGGERFVVLVEERKTRDEAAFDGRRLDHLRSAIVRRPTTAYVLASRNRKKKESTVTKLPYQRRQPRKRDLERYEAGRAL